MSRTRVMTAESVTAGHADKLCDLIADSILDAILAEDRFARVSCEVLVTTGMVVVTGQITTKCYVDITGLVRETIRRVGYTEPATGFDYQSCAVVVMLEEQARSVSLSVDRKGAGDQSIVVGYATDEGQDLPVDTHLMPVPAFLANRLTERLSAVQTSGKLAYLYPDGKAQLSILYRDGRPERLTQVVISAHHRVGLDQAQLKRDLQRLVVKPVLGASGLLARGTEILVNPLGPFTEGGPRADSGVTGRKITVDCYGACCSHGGSSFSGKDPTKPDRSGAYGARWAAKHLVAAGLAHRCSVEAAYVIGRPHPVSLEVESFGTGVLPDERLTEILREHFDLSPAAIVEDLDLRRPIYAKTAVYGHFGRPDPDFTWEGLSRLEPVAAAAPPRAGGRKSGRKSRRPERRSAGGRS
jgi:S-adenosylmethionine synthetase